VLKIEDRTMDNARVVIVIFMQHRHKRIDRINVLVLPVRYEHYPSCAINKRQNPEVMQGLVLIQTYIKNYKKEM
jgi:hypothetical protein